MRRQCFFFCVGILLGMQLMTLQSQAYSGSLPEESESADYMPYGSSGSDQQETGNYSGATYDPQSPFDYPNFAEPEEPTETEVYRQEEEEHLEDIERSSRFLPNLRGN